jgi:hypothetical protein
MPSRQVYLDRPRDKNNDQLIHGSGILRGPELRMELVTPSSHRKGSIALKIVHSKAKSTYFVTIY